MMLASLTLAEVPCFVQEIVGMDWFILNYNLFFLWYNLCYDRAEVRSSFITTTVPDESQIL